jgi:hypothetical protein
MTFRRVSKLCDAPCSRALRLGFAPAAVRERNAEKASKNAIFDPLPLHLA